MLSTIDITDIAESRTIEPAILYFGTPVVQTLQVCVGWAKRSVPTASS